jgi:hypothetical protein
MRRLDALSYFDRGSDSLAGRQATFDLILDQIRAGGIF